VKTTNRAFTTIAGKMLFRSMNNELICEGFVPRFILIELENSLLFRDGAGGLDVGEAKLLCGEPASKTPWD
jgi:hypothetical protein